MFFPKEQFELLAPGGDLDSIKAAIVAGADAIYCGLERFNARNRATNITLDILDSVLTLAHQHQCKIFITINIVLLENEIPSVIRLLQQLAGSDVDGVIVQDLGLAYIIKHYFPELDMHASTQMNTHNEGQMLLLSQLGSSRVNLSRELNIDEITHLAQLGRQHNVMTEVFVHGSYCIGFSGLCYFSSERSGASGNRGRCSQPCRDQYQTTSVGKNYPLNLKDNSAYTDIAALAKAGVYSLKVEGRIKKPHYVYTVVDNWRKQIDQFCETGTIRQDMTELYHVFNRDFTNGYLQGDIHRDMYIDNPRNHAATHFSTIYQCRNLDEVKQVKQRLYDKTTEIIDKVETLTRTMPIEPKARRSLKGNSRRGDISIPKQANSDITTPPQLSVLISDSSDLELMNSCSDVSFFYQLPDALNYQLEAMIALFNHHPTLIPFFPAVLIGEHYQAAIELLRRINPDLLVTDNLGVAHIAQTLGINWVAGPQLNITNSFALQCIQQELKGVGAFISDEINALQMRKIVRPQGVRLFYTLYHPIHLMTSRQCFFMSTVGCKKPRMNKGCMMRCEKTASIISLKERPYVIHKQKGSHNRLYSDVNCLNLAVLEDLPSLYTDFMIDLRHIPTQTQIQMDKKSLIEQFKRALQGDLTAKEMLLTQIQGTTNKQYQKGL
ncbi:U32 family peptidase [Vibrio sp. V27_P1S3P104]|uniref:peptidase U32 family protein n=1 Tax=Vibrio TaxID=662 RepID=UPI000C16C882|nr:MULTISPECIES: peptidase U32 family protein [Vibrio]NAW68329.1 U32 family peptidase [Vibrio sp. V28_P6S34P95]NAX05230.1 U32 family peptidase [Vibrio sp. V30_P3S12P165]NAX33044.1 U32 family peptidase [Vibrio sp. V29_P1S30P107]NAX36049.1 U32 family peptidase [Vibrio sp. V27_P1S3P104]NAX39122.1 U32 family peptidase [Vibrio sp. V26_P1S5P106]